MVLALRPLGAARRAAPRHAVNRDGICDNIVRAAKLYGLAAKGLTRKPDEIAAMAMPVIVFWNFNHFITIEGLNNDKVWINDPATGPRSITASEFDEGFTGVVLTFEPTPEFKPGGVAPSIVKNLADRLQHLRGGLMAIVLAGFLLLVPGLLLRGCSAPSRLLPHRQMQLAVVILQVSCCLTRATMVFLQQHLIARLQLGWRDVERAAALASCICRPVFAQNAGRLRTAPPLPTA